MQQRPNMYSSSNPTPWQKKVMEELALTYKQSLVAKANGAGTSNASAGASLILLNPHNQS